MTAGLLGDRADMAVQMLGGRLQVSPGSGRPDTQLPGARAGAAAFLSVSIGGGLRPTGPYHWGGRALRPP